ncbi:cellulase family glycosylhydrolase [Flavobacteriaceae bacterium 3-367]
MNSRWNKHMYRALLLLSFLGINALVLIGIGSTFSYLNSGADRASMLHLAHETETTYLPKVHWSTLKNKGRDMEAQTLRDIERDYLRAWYLRHQAYRHADASLSQDHYTDSAQAKLKAIIDFNKKRKINIHGITLSHHPDLEFYSADGKLVVFTDSNVRIHEAIYQNGELLRQQTQTHGYQVMMLLEDGFWRIRHMTALEGVQSTQPPDGKAAIPELKVNTIKGLNYYPRDTPWELFGPLFSTKITERDFERIRKMGLNTVRVFVPYDGFGPDQLTKLENLMDIAEEKNLKVMLTLFDFYGDYDISDWSRTHRYAEIIVQGLKDHQALLAWDVKNEPDLDFVSRGESNVKAWLQELVFQIKNWDPTHPVTIGWSHPEKGSLLADQVDFVSFHYYLEPSDFPQAVAKLRETVPHKPLLLQEYGYSTYSGFWNLFSGSEQEQARYYKDMQQALEKEELPYMFWTLYDFEAVPKKVVGGLPWRRSPQQYFGCFDRVGRPKASYKYLISTAQDQ